MTEIILRNAQVVTMDAERRVLEGVTVHVLDGRIRQIGDESAMSPGPDAVSIECRGHVVMPGLVDLHGYMGGSILKSTGAGLNATRRREFLERVISQEIDFDWWATDARLAAVERVKFGTTCMFTMMGGNGTRTDDPEFARVTARELSRVGMRGRLGIGPGRPPWPRDYAVWADGEKRLRKMHFEDVLEACEASLRMLAEVPGGLVDGCTALSRFGNKNEHDPVWSPEKEKWVFRQAEAVQDLATRFDVGFWTHVYGNAIEFAYENFPGLMGKRAVFSHCTGITDRAIAIMAETGTNAAHHPRAARIYSTPGRCPLPEMLGAGVNVTLGADAPSTHDCDMFQDMKFAQMAQRMHFKDPSLLSGWECLEMATINGYRALGLDDELGTVEVGKRADLIVIDMRKPHLAPFDDLANRLVQHVSGHDVAHVIVDGRLVMADRKMLTLDEGALLDEVQDAFARVTGRIAALN